MIRNLATTALGAVLLILPGYGLAADFNQGGRLIFAVGFLSPQSSNNFIQIGDVAFAGNELRVNYQEFDARQNRKPVQTSFPHKFFSPAPRKACRDVTIKIPSESRRVTQDGNWRNEGGILRLEIGSRTYEWEPLDNRQDSFRLRLIRGAAPGQGESAVVGYAYAAQTATAPARLKKDSFYDYYDGHYFHKDNNATAFSPWQSQRTGLKISAFEQTENDDVLAYSSADSKDARAPWVANGILLNQGPDRSIVYQDLGHDFNRNGCYDEYGHNKVMMPAQYDRQGKVSAIVFVEYSYAYDGYPMLGVGRYFKK